MKIDTVSKAFIVNALLTAATTSLIAIEDFNHNDFLVVAEIKVRCVRANESSGDVDDNLMSAAEGRKRRQNDDQVKV